MAQKVFSSLFRYTNWQEENFLAETFSYLLSLILEKEPGAGIKILANLSGENSHTWFSYSSRISIANQVTVDEDRPDLVIETDKGKVIVILLTQNSCSSLEQLGRYSSLKQSGDKETQLVLLTRSRASLQETRSRKERFHQVCWYQISAWLSQAGFTDQGVCFLTRQFLDYLQDKEISMEKISRDQLEGLPAQVNLARMLGVAIAEALPAEKSSKTAGWKSIGYSLEESDDLWIGFHFREPNSILFEQGNGKTPAFQRVLCLPEVDFFSLSGGEQLESLISFVRETYFEYCAQEATSFASFRPA